MIWFTSDTHFSHKNIIKYCERPFDDTDHMDETIIENWNSVVAPEDMVYHLGDIALGPIDQSLAKVARLNGHKIAVLGNHDRPFMRAGKPDESKWFDRYAEVFQDIIHWRGTLIEIGSNLDTVKISHFPYEGDHTETDRYQDVRPHDIGTPLIHGHTHSTDILTHSKRGTPMYHVGQDAHNYFPVPETEIIKALGF